MPSPEAHGELHGIRDQNYYHAGHPGRKEPDRRVDSAGSAARDRLRTGFEVLPVLW